MTDPTDNQVTLTRGEAVQPAPRVSVIVPAYRAIHLEEALASVRAQTLDAYEIILVDDGSPQPVAPARTDDLVLVRQPNAGPGAARNRAMSLARGEYFAFLDSDDLWLPTKLARQVAFMDEHPRVVLSSTDLFVLDCPDRAPLLKRFGHREGVFRYADLVRENCVGTSAVMVRADTVARTGGMPARYLAEDYAFWLELGLLGELALIDEPLVYYRLAPDSLSHNAQRIGVFQHAEIEVYEEFFAAHPEIGRLACATDGLARAHFDHGYALLQAGRAREALVALFKSVHFRPTQRKAWLNLFRAWWRSWRETR